MNLYFIFYILSLISKGVIKVEILKKEVIFYLKKDFLLYILFFFKKHTNLQLKGLIDITCVDYPKKDKRFELIYSFLSVFFFFRVRFKILNSEYAPVNSLCSIFKGSNWLEREIWDMYGVFFSNHPDLRRILTDYGFEGFPLRKDFPLSGFVEVRYDEERKCVVYEKISLAQEYRSFSFSNPWEYLVNSL